jgi:hypothetical protein
MTYHITALFNREKVIQLCTLNPSEMFTLVHIMGHMFLLQSEESSLSPYIKTAKTFGPYNLGFNV